MTTPTWHQHYSHSKQPQQPPQLSSTLTSTTSINDGRYCSACLPFNHPSTQSSGIPPPIRATLADTPKVNLLLISKGSDGRQSIYHNGSPLKKVHPTPNSQRLIQCLDLINCNTTSQRATEPTRGKGTCDTTVYEKVKVKDIRTVDFRLCEGPPDNIIPDETKSS